MTSVVMPAHNEAAAIAASLEAVRAQLAPGDELIVVCNGCTDATAEVARRHAPDAEVIELAAASKIAALNAGDAAASSFPRLFIDADVELASGSVPALIRALDDPEVWLAAPAVRHDTRASSPAVRSYYRIWSRLPSVRDDTVSRGCYALSARGRAQFAAFPDVLGDDHFVRDAVPPEHRAVVADAVSTVRAPHTLRAVLRRKTRTVLGNVELDRDDAPARQRAAARRRQWLGVVRGNPLLVVDVPVFLVASLWPRAVAAVRRRAGRTGGWDRDDTHGAMPASPDSSSARQLDGFDGRGGDTA